MRYCDTGRSRIERLNLINGLNKTAARRFAVNAAYAVSFMYIVSKALNVKLN